MSTEKKSIVRLKSLNLVINVFYNLVIHYQIHKICSL